MVVQKGLKKAKAPELLKLHLCVHVFHLQLSNLTKKKQPSAIANVFLLINKNSCFYYIFIFYMVVQKSLKRA